MGESLKRTLQHLRVSRAKRGKRNLLLIQEFHLSLRFGERRTEEDGL